MLQTSKSREKQQNLYYAINQRISKIPCMNTMQKMCFFVQAIFLKGPCFILWYDDYYSTIIENFLGNW